MALLLPLLVHRLLLVLAALLALAACSYIAAFRWCGAHRHTLLSDCRSNRVSQVLRDSRVHPFCTQSV